MKNIFFILGQLNDEDVEWICSNGIKEEVPSGNILIHEGKHIESFYILLKGKFSISIKTIGSSDVSVLSKGEFIGEMSFADTRPPTATVSALENSIVLSIPRENLTAKMNEDVGFASRFYRALAITLVYRYRDLVGKLSSDGAKAQDTDSDVLDENVLDNVYLAGKRYNRILERLASGT